MNPLKQGLKLFYEPVDTPESSAVFIHESIKTRVETLCDLIGQYGEKNVFIHESIKTRVETGRTINDLMSKYPVFIHESIKTRVETSPFGTTMPLSPLSLSMNPLKQGLKLQARFIAFQLFIVFIHESIKTRVETWHPSIG